MLHWLFYPPENIHDLYQVTIYRKNKKYFLQLCQKHNVPVYEDQSNQKGKTITYNVDRRDYDKAFEMALIATANVPDIWRVGETIRFILIVVLCGLIFNLIFPVPMFIRTIVVLLLPGIYAAINGGPRDFWLLLRFTISQPPQQPHELISTYQYRLWKAFLLMFVFFAGFIFTVSFSIATLVMVFKFTMYTYSK